MHSKNGGNSVIADSEYCHVARLFLCQNFPDDKLTPHKSGFSEMERLPIYQRIVDCTRTNVSQAPHFSTRQRTIASSLPGPIATRLLSMVLPLRKLWTTEELEGAVCRKIATVPQDIIQRAVNTSRDRLRECVCRNGALLDDICKT